MKAWHIENLERIKLVESVLPKREGEVKLRVSKVAISSTDFAYFASDSPNKDSGLTVPGHSAVAYMSEDDDDLVLKMGARVVISPFVKHVEHGVSRVSVLGVDENGLLSDFVSVPAENVYALPDGIPDDEAIFAEYIALGNNVLNSLEAGKGDFVVIVGASTLGLIIAQLALYYQMIPILVDLDAEKLALAASWGVYYTLNPTYDNLERRVEEITGGRMAESSVYVGDGVPFNMALRLVKDKGPPPSTSSPTASSRPTVSSTPASTFPPCPKWSCSVRSILISIIRSSSPSTERAIWRRTLSAPFFRLVTYA